MRRAAAAVACATLLLLAALPAAAGAQTPLLSPEDAVDLAQSLADAQAEQGVCYGWNVQGDVVSTGSSTGGPDVPLQVDPQKCSRGAVQFNASVVYECSTCDNGDQADVEIASNFGNAPTPQDLADLGYEPGELYGDKDDQALMDMVGALPLLVAESGAAEPVPFETPAAGAVPASDRPTNSPGSDTFRSAGPVAAFAVVLILAGLGWFFYKLRDARRTRSRRPRTT